MRIHSLFIKMKYILIAILALLSEIPPPWRTQNLMNISSKMERKLPKERLISLSFFKRNTEQYK